ncbi:MAG: helix-turn-helix transcriptional regulator [Marinoscillum sp.]|uniref:helix-turn-helix domain-containing protein n=1 Tax=Marinoscillum sp. TaxID=2024838 RepID=UPI0032FAF15C
MTDEKEIFEAIGQRINQLRKERNLSFQELANRSNIEKANLVKLVGGKNTTVSTLEKIATGLDVHPKELWDFGG